MNKELITTVVPVHNGEAFLPRTLDSILAQTRASDEVLVVDDGSGDRSSAVAAAYGEPVRVIRQRRAGPAAARNRGIEAARGDLIAFLDADDLWHPRKLELQALSFGSDPELGISFTLLRNFSGEPPALGEESAIEELSERRLAHSACTMLARREAFERAGLFDVSRKHTHFVEWCMRARQRGVRELVLAEVLVFRRLHGANRSRRNAARSQDEFLELLKATLDQRRRGGPDESLQRPER